MQNMGILMDCFGLLIDYTQIFLIKGDEVYGNSIKKLECGR